MKNLIELISIEVRQAFADCGYREELGQVTVSNRPDLCQYQCNGAMAAAKEYKKAPFIIADEVVAKLKDNDCFSMIESVKPGFINMNVSPKYLAGYLDKMFREENYGFEKNTDSHKIIIDYGGANVAKPLHVGHLRSAIIGESIKRILSFCGNEVIGDVHLGDWGLQMGLIITLLKERQPDLVYFDDDYQGEYPTEPPFDIAQLEEIYPAANARSKVDEAFKEEARTATYYLQNKKPGYYALWKHIMNVSMVDLKKNYASLNVFFEKWGKESDAQDFIPDMITYLKENGYAYISEGALVVDVKEDTDTKEIPPCMILKSDGATLYNTTDLATLVDRTQNEDPDEIIYLTDKRQSLYFEQVFRCAKKTGIVKNDTILKFIGFGTMNGKDGKPFKTRDGGVMRLEYLIKDIENAVYEKVREGRDLSEEEAKEISRIVGLSALKYGDLSNQASKDYIFDVDRFSSFEGNTGPYILYTMVRIKSILAKCDMPDESLKITESVTESEEELKLILTRFAPTIERAGREYAPHIICQYIYELSDAFNSFYHNNKVVSQEDENVKASWIALLKMTLGVLGICIDLLGFEAPDKM